MFIFDRDEADVRTKLCVGWILTPRICMHAGFDPFEFWVTLIRVQLVELDIRRGPKILLFDFGSHPHHITLRSIIILLLLL
jgi:L-asparagine transporter-like permease